VRLRLRALGVTVLPPISQAPVRAAPESEPALGSAQNDDQALDEPVELAELGVLPEAATALGSAQAVFIAEPFEFQQPECVHCRLLSVWVPYDGARIKGTCIVHGVPFPTPARLAVGLGPEGLALRG